jgi:hypothetical protein
MTATNLHDIQQWMMTVLMTPSNLQDGLTAANQTFHTHENHLIAQAAGADRFTRLSIYKNSYLLRLQQCLEADYPALLNLMGEELFQFFSSAYIWRYPSRSTTLYDLGKDFPDFLRQTQSSLRDSAEHQYLLPIELAYLERKRTETLRAKDFDDSAPPPTIIGFSPISPTYSAIILSPCLRLVKSSYPLKTFIEAIDAGESSPELPPVKDNYLAITRKHYRAIMQDIEAWQYYFMLSLQEGNKLDDSVQFAALNTQQDPEDIRQELIFWLPLAADMGFIRQTPNS